MGAWEAGRCIARRANGLNSAAMTTAHIDPFLRNTRIAYFSMEIALRNEIHTYAGGLGVLAGDTARSCADLKIPVVFVTLLSRMGYLRQEIDDQGRQVDRTDPWNPSDWATPLEAMIAIELEGRSVWIRPWLYVLHDLDSSVPIILLDTDLAENGPADREITHYLYGGSDAYRLQQEAVLGIGGLRLLRALGFKIDAYHMNEGHAALLTVELLREELGSTGGAPCDLEAIRERCIFTTHTPIEAGHDQFDYGVVERVLGDFVPMAELKHHAGGTSCNMTRLALNLSAYVNGVASRHAETTRQMFPGYQVRAISNGVHTGMWAHRAFARLYDARFPQWLHEPEALAHADQLENETVWRAHQEAKEDLIAFIKDKTGAVLDPNIALIGFARRMTGFKRPELLFTDPDQLERISRKHPFQVVLAGKAHPHDVQGKQSIENLHRHIRNLERAIRIVFLPNHDLDVAGHLVSGTDIWLNTPLPPLEASGTSGMKAAINGVLNLSVLDGWWLEAWIEGVTGWAIGSDVTNRGSAHATDLYDKLRDTVLPLYYEDRAGWIRMMKETISKIAAHFNSHRMMRRYATEAYLHRIQS
jgi:starch phosphorylase